MSKKTKNILYAFVSVLIFLSACQYITFPQQQTEKTGNQEENTPSETPQTENARLESSGVSSEFAQLYPSGNRKYSIMGRPFSKLTQSGDFGEIFTESSSEVTCYSINGCPFVKGRPNNLDLSALKGTDVMLTMGKEINPKVTWEVMPNNYVSYVFRIGDDQDPRHTPKEITESTFGKINFQNWGKNVQFPASFSFVMQPANELDKGLINGRLFTETVGAQGGAWQAINANLAKTASKNALFIGDGYLGEMGGKTLTDNGLYWSLDHVNVNDEAFYKRVFSEYKYWRDQHNANFIIQNGEFLMNSPAALRRLKLMKKAAAELGVKLGIWSTPASYLDLNRLDRDKSKEELNVLLKTGNFELTPAARADFDQLHVNFNMQFSGASAYRHIFQLLSGIAANQPTSVVQWLYTEPTDGDWRYTKQWYNTPNGKEAWGLAFHSPAQLDAALKTGFFFNKKYYEWGRGFGSTDLRYFNTDKDGKLISKKDGASGQEVHWTDHYGLNDYIAAAAIDMSEIASFIDQSSEISYADFDYKGLKIRGDNRIPTNGYKTHQPIVFVRYLGSEALIYVWCPVNNFEIDQVKVYLKSGKIVNVPVQGNWVEIVKTEL